MKKSTMVLLVALLIGGSAPLAAGWNSNSLKGLDPSLTFSNFAFLNAAGDPVYYLGDVIRYRVTVKNNGNRPFKRFPVNSTLYWRQSASCTSGSFSANQDLPGNSNSGLHYLTLEKNETMSFDVSYVIPMNVCPNNVLLRMDTGRGGGQFDSFRFNQKIQIRER